VSTAIRLKGPLRCDGTLAQWSSACAGAQKGRSSTWRRLPTQQQLQLRANGSARVCSSANGSRVGSRRGPGFDADVSSIPPIIPYGGFSPVRLHGWFSKRRLPGSSAAQACSRHTPSDVRFASALRAPRSRSDYPALCRAAGSIAHRHGGLLLLRPRGPRSGPGYSVPVRHHLIDPIRPTRGHTAISPHGGLYAMPAREFQ
jgi:hypothetical protein